MSKQAFEKIKSGLDEAIIIAPYVAEIERLRAENEKLRAALKPFYEWEKQVEGSQHFDTMPDENIMLTTGAGETEKWIYRKHLRAAAAALKETGDE